MLPRSMRMIVLRLNPLRSASCSCVRWACSRARETATAASRRWTFLLVQLRHLRVGELFIQQVVEAGEGHGSILPVCRVCRKFALPDFALWCFLGFLGETVGDDVVIMFGVEVAGALDVVGELRTYLPYRAFQVFHPLLPVASASPCSSIFAMVASSFARSFAVGS